MRWREDMLKVSRVLLVVSGLLLILDAVLMATGTPNPLFGWPLPCPLTLTVLAVGILLFALGSNAFKKG
jgi:hypothetical protein